MTFDSAVNKIWDGLEKKLTLDSVLPVFVGQRKKFEGWLKVEVCRILHEQGLEVIPENECIDVTTPNWAIELKTVPTNYSHPGIPHPHAKNITASITDIIKDIKDLKQNKYENRMVLFLVYPLDISSKSYNWWGWDHLTRLTPLLYAMKEKPFEFQNGFPGIAYFGRVE